MGTALADHCAFRGRFQDCELSVVVSTGYHRSGVGTVFRRGQPANTDFVVSKILHLVPDAALGPASYLLDAVTGAIGGTRRWRTMPWIVILFGLAVGPLGIVSVTLVILQPVLFDSWCTLCLCSAVISVVMIGPAMDEFLASLQYVRRESRAGRSPIGVYSGG
jgi:hypothetical protein